MPNKQTKRMCSYIYPRFKLMRIEDVHHNFDKNIPHRSIKKKLITVLIEGAHMRLYFAQSSEEISLLIGS